MNQVMWNNKMKSRGRRPVAIIVGADGVEVVKPEGAKVLSVEHSRGYHGGYVSVKVALHKEV